jgi:hypothetical protein
MRGLVGYSEASDPLYVLCTVLKNERNGKLTDDLVHLSSITQWLPSWLLRTLAPGHNEVDLSRLSSSVAGY